MPSSSSSSVSVSDAASVMASSSSSLPLTNDQLAAQLMQCAILVKKGERGPLVRKTVLDLTDYLSAAAAPPPPAATPPAPAPPPASSGNLSTASASSATSTLSKPTKAPFIAGLGKIMGLTDDGLPHRSHDSKVATSAKNAQRVRADLASAAPSSGSSAAAQHHHPKHNWLGGEEPEWCEEHFAMGCACKERKRAAAAQQQSSAAATAAPSHTAGAATTATPASTSSSHQQPPQQQHRGKPAFQRPSNPQSALIANGWIEQQRRSKMRIVWKDVLASLVEGRRRGEETTLWIQREVHHPGAAGTRAELEALHQIPLKLVERVTYHQYAPEPRFSVKMYNNPEEYLFRCRDDEAAQQWVLTLRSVQQALRSQPKKSAVGGVPDAPASPRVPTAVDDWEREAAAQQQQHQGVRRVVSEEEKKAPEYAASATAPHQQQHREPYPSPPPDAAPQAVSHRMTVTELRAIAHGAGINTHGMERGDLERIVARIAGAAGGGGAAAATPAPHPPASHSPQPPTVTQVPPVANNAAPPQTSPKQPQNHEDDEVMRRRHQQLAEEAERRQQEELKRRKSQEEAAARAATAAAAQKQQQLEAERQRQRREEEERERQRLAQERLRRDEEEMQRKLAEKRAAEARRQQEEAQRAQQQQWQQQQQAWKKQQEEEELRRRAAEQQAAEARRQQEEAYRRQQQWQQSQAPHQQSAPSPNPPQYAQGAYPQRPGYPPQPPGGPPHPGFHPQAAGAAPPPSHGGFPGPAPGPQAPPQQGSAVNMKYAKMAQQSDDGAAIWNIKHGILIQWALLPPMLQVLRPIEDLLTSVHNVFPPKFGVPGHEYFTKWTAITYDEISQGPALGNRPDDAKLKKAMRKLRFFLHPDKLPRDLSKEQSFMCKMLWDIISDAEAEHKKKEEELGWIRG